MVPWPHPNNPRVLKVTLVFKRDTRTLLNVFHVSRPIAWDNAAIIAFSAIVQNWFNANYKGVIPSDIALSQMQFRKQDPADPLAYDVNLSPALAGTRGAPTEAANATVTMSARTGFAGRAYRGRMYVPGLIEGDVTADDRISSALAVGLANAANQLIAVLITWGVNWCIFHRPGLVPKPLDNTFTNVTSYVIENILDSQRRRLPSRGR